MTDTRAEPNLFSRDPAERRAFRDELGRGIGRFIPPELRPLLGFVAGATPSAAVERAGAASMRAVQPGRTGAERLGDVGEVLSETAGVVAPAMVAGRAAMPAAEAAQEALLGISVPARAASETVIERLNQPGPVPERVYSGLDPEEFLRLMRGRRDADRVQRSLEEAAANDAIRAERGLPPLRSESGLRVYHGGPERVEAPEVREDSDGMLPGFSVARVPEVAEMYARQRGGGVVSEFELDTQRLNAMDELEYYDFLADLENRLGFDEGDLPESVVLEELRNRGINAISYPDEEFGIRLLDPSLLRPVSGDFPAAPASFQSSAQGAAVRPQLGEPFDDWIDRIYAPENRGPDNVVQDPNVVFRAMSPEEAAFGEAEGVFRDVSGAPLYVANDPERYVGGGAYGGKNRGRIYEFDVTDIPSETRAGTVGIVERAVSEIPAERIRRIWEWDPERRSHVLVEDRTAARGPEGFAQGGAVMMRSDMPQQINQGVGSLSEVARGMFGAPRRMQEGGAVQRDPMMNAAYRGSPRGSRIGRPVSGPALEVNEGASPEFLAQVRQRVMAETGLDPNDIAMERGIDPELFLRLIAQESRGDQGAVSEAGAIGLTQLMPETAAELGVDPRSAGQNMRGGAEYLGRQLNEFQDISQGLAAYNAGPGRVDEFGGIPPFSETRQYVSRIMGVPGGQMAVGPLMRPEVVRPEPRPMRAQGIGSLPATRPVPRP